jgi:hypothetical protein
MFNMTSEFTGSATYCIYNNEAVLIANYHVVKQSCTYEVRGDKGRHGFPLPPLGDWKRLAHHGDAAYCKIKQINGIKPIRTAAISHLDQAVGATFVTYDATKNDTPLSVCGMTYITKRGEPEICHDVTTTYSSCGSMVLNKSGDLIAIHVVDNEHGLAHRSAHPNGAILLYPLK